MKTLSNPLLSIIIPTYNRPHLLPHAVESALAQTLDDLEVVVVDDCSAQPVNLAAHPRLRIIRLSIKRGVAAARNIGAKAALGHWLAFLDDDDQLLPHFAKVSFEALALTTLPKPVAVLSGLEVTNKDGKMIRTHLPPSLSRGSHFFLEEIGSGQSFFSKQTLVVEREVFHEIGGFDESFSSREQTELFLRLNPFCSIQGLPIVTYRLLDHQCPRISRDSSLRQVDFNRLVRKHESLFKAHPKMFANFVFEHAITSYKLDQRRAAFSSFCWAMRLNPLQTVARIGSPYWRKLRGFIK